VRSLVERRPATSLGRRRLGRSIRSAGDTDAVESIPASQEHSKGFIRDKNAGRPASRELTEHVSELRLVRNYLGRVDGGRWAGASRLAVAYEIWWELEGTFVEGDLDARDGDPGAVPVTKIASKATSESSSFVREGQLLAIRRAKRTERENPPGPVIPGIDHDLKQIGLARREAERELRRELGREPLDIEIATEVVKLYSEQDTLVKTALRKMERLARELKIYEYTFPGREAVTGRRPLPEPR